MPGSVGDWIRSNTDRDHFLVPAAMNSTLPEVERLVRGMLGGAVFEG
jgi:hypothetical protein